METSQTLNAIDTQLETTPPMPKKRGRKPKNPEAKKDKFYFLKEQEDAVLAYINSDSQQEKNRLYVTTLQPAFEKMIEAIMHRFNLYIPDEDSGTTFNDVLSFLLTRLDKFDVGRGKKAYSYYSNICKNYLIGKIQTYNKSLIRNPSYDCTESNVDLTNDIKYSIRVDRGARIASNIVEMLAIERIPEMLENPTKFGLKKNDIKLGYALINLFTNWDYVISTDGSNKLNKNAVLAFLRETTGLDNKGIRDSLKRYKKEYLLVKKIAID